MFLDHGIKSVGFDKTIKNTEDIFVKNLHSCMNTIQTKGLMAQNKVVSILTFMTREESSK